VELHAALSAETYLSADEARVWGFVTDVVEAQQAAAVNRMSPGALEALGFTRVESVGRTLSAENEGKLVDASSLIGEVLSALDAKATDPDPAGSGDAPRTMNRKERKSLLLASRRH
jgi:hypothetical protein